MNKYIIDTGAICLIVEGTSCRDVLETTLVYSALIKPSIFATHQPVVPIEQRDLIVCNVGEQEIRIYPLPTTINLEQKSFNLFTCNVLPQGDHVPMSDVTNKLSSAKELSTD